MPNDSFRRLLIAKIRSALRTSQNATVVDHAGLQGEIREGALHELIAPLLPPEFKLATGKIVDAGGGQSLQTDAIVYSPTLIPGVLLRESMGIIPVESSFSAIEVKTQLTATTALDCIQKARAVLKLLALRPVLWDALGPAHWQYDRGRVSPSLFAFGTDLKAKTEFERMAELCQDRGGSLPFASFCVVGAGFWWRGFEGWKFRAATDDHDEVIDFLCNVVDPLYQELRHRTGAALLSKYVGTRTQSNETTVRPWMFGTSDFEW